MAFVSVSQLKNNAGRQVANHYVIHTHVGDYFQSYSTIIAYKPRSGKIQLDPTYWNYSRATNRYRKIFLGEDTHTTRDKIHSGRYKMKDLN